MPSGTVQAIGQSQSGKPQVTIDGQKYSTGKTDITNLQVGDKIEFESNSSVYNGRTVWFLNSFKLLEAALKYPPKSNGTLTPPSSGITEGERAAISNWVAHAIQAGLIKDRADLGMWAVAAKNALRKAAEPTFDEDIP